jgi:hypothetical protein
VGVVESHKRSVRLFIPPPLVPNLDFKPYLHIIAMVFLLTFFFYCSSGLSYPVYGLRSMGASQVSGGELFDRIVAKTYYNEKEARDLVGIRTYTHTHIHILIHTYIYSYTHTYTHTHIHILIHTYIYSYTHNMYTHKYMYMYLYTHIYIHTYTHKHIYTCIHTNTHTHPTPHTHTSTPTPN